MRPERRAWLECLAVTRTVLEVPQLRKLWHAPSALDGWTVGTLAGHVIRGATIIGDYLDASVPENADVITATEYWRRVPGDTTLPIHAGISERARAQAERGLDALLADIDEATPRLRAACETEPDGRLTTAFAGLVLTFDDLLICRCVELTVHTDDLCASLGIDTPPLPPGATELTIETLVGAARLRHGDLAVLRALTRRERDAPEALRVL